MSVQTSCWHPSVISGKCERCGATDLPDTQKKSDPRKERNVTYLPQRSTPENSGGAIIAEIDDTNAKFGTGSPQPNWLGQNLADHSGQGETTEED